MRGRLLCRGDLGVDWMVTMSHQVGRVSREAVVPCMTCPLCHKLFRDATTIIECLHTFCKKCIYKKLSDEEMECCPVCNIDLGCVPLEKLRPDHNIQDVRTKIFPSKRIKAKTPEPEIVPPVTFPAKRKERSISSLVSTPRVSTQSGMTGRRSKSVARKASRGSSFTIEKPVKKEDDSAEDHQESSSSPETLTKFAQTTMQNYAASEPSKYPSLDNGRDNRSEAQEAKVDLWKPLNCLVEAANSSKSSKSGTQGSGSKSEALQVNEGFLTKTKIKEHRQKSNVQDERNSEHTPSESGRPKKFCKRPNKVQSYGELRVDSQTVLDAANAKFVHKNCPIWFSLIPDEQEVDALPWPQTASYIRIKDGTVPVSLIQKYVKIKLDLTNEDEVEIKCMGQIVIPALTLNNLVDLWLQTTTTERVSTTIGSSAKDFVMVLTYARKVRDS